MRSINDELVMTAPEREGREASPTADVIDNQSHKTTESCGIRSLDAGKKIMERKRHVVVDTLGLMAASSSMAPTFRTVTAHRPPALAVAAPRLRRWRLHRAEAEGSIAKSGKFTLEITKRSDSVKGF